MSDLFGDLAETRAHIHDVYSKEFGRSEDRWKSLETKAQGTVTIAGIFMGFALSFAKDLPLGAPVHITVLTILAISVLILCIGFAASSLLIASVAEPPGGNTYAQFGDDFHNLVQPPQQQEFISASWSALRARWQRAIDERNATNGSKARAVLRAQACLLLAIGIAGIMAVATAIGRTNAAPTTVPLSGVTIYEMHQMQ